MFLILHSVTSHSISVLHHLLYTLCCVFLGSRRRTRSAGWIAPSRHVRHGAVQASLPQFQVENVKLVRGVHRTDITLLAFIELESCRLILPFLKTFLSAFQVNLPKATRTMSISYKKFVVPNLPLLSTKDVPSITAQTSESENSASVFPLVGHLGCGGSMFGLSLHIFSIELLALQLRCKLEGHRRILALYL